MSTLWSVAALAGGLAAVPTGCASDSFPSCVTVDPGCAPLYPPTFANVYGTTLSRGCGADAGSCHSAQGRQGGVSFATAGQAYESLLAGQVEPGNPGCSAVIVATSSVGARFQMPPGDPLSPAERCALVQWVQAGAPGPSAQGDRP
ncbi:MAG TPA: hypothetical protein VFP84_13860 [Kofleriaceae bacterium]|nr:hypothetical protein [Kofleriaceae bacterium]